MNKENKSPYLRIRWSGLLFVLLLLISSCRGDWEQFEEGSTFRLRFSQDTLRLDTLFSDYSSSTYEVKVYNDSKKAIRINRVSLVGGEEKGFRVNVDGRSGTNFSDLILGAKDSLFVFVEAFFPTKGEDLPELVRDHLQFEFNRQKQNLYLEAWRQNSVHKSSLIVARDSIIRGDKPLLIKDSLVVKEGVQLTLEAGLRILMGDKAHISVYGSLRAEGSVQNPIMIEGIRQDFLLPDINYRQVAGQWDSIYFAPTSTKNFLQCVTIRNGRKGVVLRAEEGKNPPFLELDKVQIYNMKGSAISSYKGKIKARNSLFANTLLATLMLNGGESIFDFCSMVNYFAWDNREGRTLVFQKPKDEGGLSSLQIHNSVIDGSFSSYGEGEELRGEIRIDSDLFDKTQIENSYLRVAPLSASFFQNCIQAKEKVEDLYEHYGYDKKKKQNDFKYDFHPLPTAAFVAKAVPVIKEDADGRTRPNLASYGCFEPLEKSAANKKK